MSHQGTVPGSVSTMSQAPSDVPKKPLPRPPAASQVTREEELGPPPPYTPPSQGMQMAGAVPRKPLPAPPSRTQRGGAGGRQVHSHVCHQHAVGAPVPGGLARAQSAQVVSRSKPQQWQPWTAPEPRQQMLQRPSQPNSTSRLPTSSSLSSARPQMPLPSPQARAVPGRAVLSASAGSQPLRTTQPQPPSKPCRGVPRKPLPLPTVTKTSSSPGPGSGTPEPSSEAKALSRESSLILSPRTPSEASVAASADATHYFVNQKKLKSKDVAVFTSQVAPMPPGSYWYDADSGLWSIWGHPTAGFATAGLRLPSKEPAPLLPHSSLGDTGVFVNGRELSSKDSEVMSAMGFDLAVGRWLLDCQGKVTEDSAGPSLRKKVTPLAADADLTVLVTGMHKDRAGFVVYDADVFFGNEQWRLGATYSNILAFHRAVKKLFPSLPLAKLPDSKSAMKNLGSLETYLSTVLQFSCIRENVTLLQKININSPIVLDVPSHLNLVNESWKKPLAGLSDVNRTLVGQTMVALSCRWGYRNQTTMSRINNVMLLAREEEKKAEKAQQESTVHKKQDAADLEKSLVEVLLARLSLTEDLLTSAVRSGMCNPCDSGDEVLIGSDLLKQLDEADRWSIVWELLLQSIVLGQMDARVHVTLHILSKSLGIGIHQLASAEGECAACLQKQLIEMAKIKQKSQSSNRKMKIAAGAALGGGALLVASIIALPLTLSVLSAGIGVTAGAATALGFGAGISSGIVMAGGLLTMAAPMLPLIFGTGGAALCAWKVHHITGGVAEFKFVQVHKKKIPEGRKVKYLDPLLVEEDDLSAPSEPFEIDWEKGVLVKSQSTLKLEPAKPEASSAEDGEDTTAETPLVAPESEVDAKAEKKKVKKEKKKKKKKDMGEYTEEEEEVVAGAGMQVVIGVNGWLWNEKEVTSNWNTIKHLNESAEVYSLRWETEDLMCLGNFVKDQCLSEVAGQIAESIIPGLNALAMPMLALTAVDFVANPWSIAANHAKKAGKVLCQAIIEKAAGHRPVTLIGWSLGARVIFFCLEELARMGDETSLGLIENVFLIGAPVSAKTERWSKFPPLVAGRLVNVYSKADWLMPWVHTCTVTKGKKKRTAGTQVVDVEGVENYDVTKLNGGHLNYRRNLKKIIAHLNIHDSSGKCTPYKSRKKLAASASQPALPTAVIRYKPSPLACSQPAVLTAQTGSTPRAPDQR